MKDFLTGAVVVLVVAGVFSAFILGVRAINEGTSADLIGPAIAIAAFILPATFLVIPLIEPPFSCPPPPPPPWTPR